MGVSVGSEDWHLGDLCSCTSACNEGEILGKEVSFLFALLNSFISFFPLPLLTLKVSS